MTQIANLARQISGHPKFEPFIIGVILFGAVLLGLETSPVLMASYAVVFEWANQFVLLVFIIEAAIKICAAWPKPHHYFKNGWNVFDFTIILLCLIPSTGPFALVARTARLFRVLRLVTAIPELRLIVATLLRSIPSMGHIVVLMGMVFYMYGIAGYHLFHEHDPQHWASLGLSLLTLFRIVTLEDWTDIMYKAMELHPYTWVFFVTFVVLATFVVVNLFIAVVINNLHDARHADDNATGAPTIETVMVELAALNRRIEQLTTELERPPKTNE